MFNDFQVQRWRVYEQPLEVLVAQHLRIAADLLNLDKDGVRRLASQDVPLRQVGLVAVQVEHRHPGTLQRGSSSQGGDKRRLS